MSEPAKPKGDLSQKSTLPIPTKAEGKRAAHARERGQARHARLEARVQDAESKVVGPNHSDALSWQTHLLDALGTTSIDFSSVMLGQLEWACRQRGEKALSQTSVNAALAVLDGLLPENEAEAMLGVQMVGTHALAMELLGRARHAEYVSVTQDFANLAVRLLRTYTAQLETLAKLRRKGEQSVRVEHVHVHGGANAIVGNVNEPGRPTGEV